MFSLMRPESIGRRYWLATYIPLVVFVILHFLLNFIRGSMPVLTNYDLIRENIGEPELWLRFAAAFLFLAEMGIFAVQTFRMQRQHVRNLQSDFSYTEGSTLGWIRWNISIILLKGIIVVLLMLLEGRMIKVFACLIFIIEPILTTIWVVRQKDLYRQPDKNNPVAKEDIFDNIAGDIELLSEKHKKLKQDLLDLLDRDEIYKDPELNSEKVREMLGTNRTYLSQVINRDLNTTFYQLINTYRLNKAVEMMKDPLHRQMPLKSISEICGFKSLGAFSTFFKQTYGKTPTEWKVKN
jgi:AraC-like DNA-binding protein